MLPNVRGANASQFAANFADIETSMRVASEVAQIGSFVIDIESGNIFSSANVIHIPGSANVQRTTLQAAFERVHKDDAAHVRKAFEAAVRSDKEGHLQAEFRYLSPRGNFRWIACRGRVETSFGSGKPRRIIGAWFDVTERKMAEAKLRESEQRFRGIFEHAATGIAITDENNRFLACNPAFSRMTGYSEDELRQLAFPTHIHPEDREENVLLAKRLFAGEIPSFEITNRYVSKEGEILWVQKHVSVFRDEDGKPSHVLVLATNISEQKRQQDHIRLLMREVNHRSKNMLSLVQAIARQTLSASPTDFLDRFGMRVEALAANQDLLVKNDWKGVEIGDLVRSQLAHFEDLIGKRIELKGPPLFISASAAQTLGMSLHELAANAAKHGALADAEGRIEIEWTLDEAAGGEASFAMRWRELSAFPIEMPARLGFGWTVIYDMTEAGLEAKVELRFPKTGLTWQLTCAAESVLA